MFRSEGRGPKFRSPLLKRTNHILPSKDPQRVQPQRGTRQYNYQRPRIEDSRTEKGVQKPYSTRGQRKKASPLSTPYQTNTSNSQRDQPDTTTKERERKPTPEATGDAT